MMGGMQLPIDVPVAPMLARLVTEVPVEEIRRGAVFEPKWDGFRCIILRDGDQIELASRMNKSLTAYFPEVIEKVRETLPPRCVVDSELIVPTGQLGAQRLDWDALSARVHPSLRKVAKLAAQTPAEVVAFDLLSLGEDDLTNEPLWRRRALLQDVVAPGSGMHVTAQADDPEIAKRWFDSFAGYGFDGVMIKRRDSVYEYGRRSWLKMKQARTAEAVVVGFRRNPRYRGVGVVLLGMYGPDNDLLYYVGAVASFTPQQRIDLADRLGGLVSDPPVGEQPIDMPAQGTLAHLRSVPVRPELVMEVEFDQLDGRQFRHAARFRRWRPDRDPMSCRLDQLDVGSSYDLAEMLGSTPVSPASP